MSGDSTDLFEAIDGSLNCADISRPFQPQRSLKKVKVYFLLAVSWGVAVHLLLDSSEAARLYPTVLAESEISYEFRDLEIEGFIGEKIIGTISDFMKSFSGSGAHGFMEF